MRTAGYYMQGRRSFFRLREKGRCGNVMLAHHSAQKYMDTYLGLAERVEEAALPVLFTRTAGSLGGLVPMKDIPVKWAHFHILWSRAKQDPD